MKQFNDHCNMGVIGCSSSGKSTLVARILLHAKELFPTKPTKVIYAYTMWQPLFEKLQSQMNELIFVEGLPSEEYIRDQTTGHNHSIMVLDDMWGDLVGNDFVRDVVNL